MKYQDIIDSLSSKMESRYGTIEGKRTIKETHKAEDNTFDCTYEYLIAGDLYTLSIWGDYDYYVWKVNKLLECESVDNRSGGGGGGSNNKIHVSGGGGSSTFSRGGGGGNDPITLDLRHW